MMEEVRKVITAMRSYLVAEGCHDGDLLDATEVHVALNKFADEIEKALCEHEKAAGTRQRPAERGIPECLENTGDSIPRPQAERNVRLYNARDKVKEAYEILIQWEADEAAGVAGTTDKPEAKSASEALFAARMLLQEALRLPPRQCDVGTADEQGERCMAQFNEWRRKGDGKKLITAIMAWAQMPYTEKGGTE